MEVRNTGPLGVVIQYDAENSARAIVVSPQEAIKLRDLLRRELPVAAEPEWCAACGKTPCNCTAPEPSEPDPDEVRRLIEVGGISEHPSVKTRLLLVRVCEAWLRSREQQPKLEAAWSDEVLAFNGKTYADDKARERRERIATAVLAGLVANPRVIQFWPESDIDEFAQRRAHALIAALNKEQP